MTFRLVEGSSRHQGDAVKQGRSKKQVQEGKEEVLS
jgi:hypothetical protein